MKRLLALALATLALEANATDYYACDCGTGSEGGCTNGNDGGAGTIGDPWRTYDVLENAVAGSACGDTFNFCRGGAFVPTGDNNWTVNSQDCSGNPKRIREYQPGAFTQKPIVGVASGAGITFDFTNNVGSSGGMILEDLNVACGAGVAAPGTCTTGSGTIFVNMLAVEIDDVIVDGWTVGIEVAYPKNLVVRNSVIRDNAAQGIVGQAGDATITGNQFINNGCLVAGSDCTQQRALYLNCTAGNGCESNDRQITVTGNTFTDNTIRPDDPDGGGPILASSCQGNAISLRGGNPIVFNGNTIRQKLSPEPANCIAVRMSSITDATEQVCNGCSASGNLIIGGEVGIQVEAWTGSGTIENNTIYLPGRALYDNFQRAIEHNIATVGTVDSVDLKIRNNSMVVGTMGAGSLTSAGLDLRGSAGNVLVYNNAIRMIGTGANDVCMRLQDSTNVSTNYVGDNNICHRENVNAWYAHWTPGGSSGRRQLATVQTDASPDEASSQDGDPGFVATSPAFDFTIQAGDLAVNAGYGANFAPLDYVQVSRPQGSNPDVGAYELVETQVYLPSRKRRGIRGSR